MNKILQVELNHLQLAIGRLYVELLDVDDRDRLVATMPIINAIEAIDRARNYVLAAKQRRLSKPGRKRTKNAPG